jgi:DNA-binding transcriptional MerR regulator
VPATRPARPDAKVLGGQAVVSRGHLSIGEVLSLLQDEFPDVTISKIRFLESQGLVDPERTPSGYRKFYDADIDRLRWVLRQQRDAFLPLKVIKGRLDSQPGPSDEETDGGVEAEDLGEELAGPDVIVDDATEQVVADEMSEAQGGGAEEPVDHQLGGREERLFDAGPPYSEHGKPAGSDDRPGLHRRSPAGQRGTARTIGGGQAARHGQRRSDGAAGVREERPPGSHRAGAGRVARADLGGEARSRADEHDLTLDELLEEAGVDVEEVRELEGFGLITPKVIGGSHYYTRDAAIVARLASAFARHGVEARHLRAYKGAADREAGLVEQVIMPLIRQRNPEARQAAAQAVEELSHLGGELRAVLLRSALADLH